MRENTSWNTSHEVEFLKHLGNGKWSDSGFVRSRGRKEMLKRYLRATQFRDDWGAISRVQAVGYAETLLEQEG